MKIDNFNIALCTPSQQGHHSGWIGSAPTPLATIRYRHSSRLSVASAYLFIPVSSPFPYHIASAKAAGLGQSLASNTVPSACSGHSATLPTKH
ncbi:hypothetical protein AMTR_s00088p00105090 [Amborella trichopoda]|uniref:Uncharacterized protein n=1 Tax=Amborella trichopoda TaxID=13333 RepID=W1NXY1_AMBTC|nr:hypothetical protein AMTR_s00088p00105090 [Amborella trichopoda]